MAAQQADPLAAAVGEASTSSSDGQHLPLGGRGESTGAVNPHKGSAPAISFYTHISGRYAPYHSKPISVADGEALHVLDGLLYHGADLNAAVHHTDGGGVSDHVFALCYLLGFRFAPRIPNLHDRRLYTFGAAAQWPHGDREPRRLEFTICPLSAVLCPFYGVTPLVKTHHQEADLRILVAGAA